MPIRPEMKSRYPKDWKAIRARIQARAGNKCEWCGVSNLAWMAAATEKDARRTWLVLAIACMTTNCPVDLARVVRIVCTTAHVHDPSPENCADDNLAFLCQRCHLRHDAHYHAGNAAETRRKRKAARAAQAGG